MPRVTLEFPHLSAGGQLRQGKPGEVKWVRLVQMRASEGSWAIGEVQLAFGLGGGFEDGF